MASYREFMDDYLVNMKCRGKLKAKSDAEVLVTKLCEKLDEMGGGGIKTVVIKGVEDETTGKMVYTPNMTYEEVRDMMLNLEPFNVLLVNNYALLTVKMMWGYALEATYEHEKNRIELRVLYSSGIYTFYWTAAGIVLYHEPK